MKQNIMLSLPSIEPPLQKTDVYTFTITYRYMYLHAQGLVTSPFLVYEIIKYNIQSKEK